jgi:hypothetical protein
MRGPHASCECNTTSLGGSCSAEGAGQHPHVCRRMHTNMHVAMHMHASIFYIHACMMGAYLGVNTCACAFMQDNV